MQKINFRGADIHKNATILEIQEQNQPKISLETNFQFKIYYMQ